MDRGFSSISSISSIRSLLEIDPIYRQENNRKSIKPFTSLPFLLFLSKGFSVHISTHTYMTYQHTNIMQATFFTGLCCAVYEVARVCIWSVVTLPGLPGLPFTWFTLVYPGLPGLPVGCLSGESDEVKSNR
jgi:hypothetical protein